MLLPRRSPPQEEHRPPVTLTRQQQRGAISNYPPLPLTSVLTRQCANNCFLKHVKQKYGVWFHGEGGEGYGVVEREGGKE